MNKLPNFQPATFESVWASIQENERYLREMFAESDRIRKENERILNEKFAETEQLIRENGLQMKETDRKFAETEQLIRENGLQMKETKKLFSEADRRMKKIEELVGGIGNNNGEMAEEYFFNAFKRSKTFVNETFERVLRNKCINNCIWHAEFDLLLLNGKSAAIIEVKYRAKPENITVEKLLSRIEPFKVLFPDYKNCKIYLGVAAMSFNKYLAKQLHEAGIATIHQEGKKMVVWDMGVKVF